MIIQQKTVQDRKLVKRTIMTRRNRSRSPDQNKECLNNTFHTETK